MEALHLEPGTTIGGKYELIRVIGEGGMGVVYEATHLRLDQRVAIKMLHAGIAYHPDLVKRFEREARATARIVDPHIVEILDVDVMKGGTPYMVFELLDGCDLGDEIERNGRMEPRVAADIIRQAAGAMMAAHRAGIIHRDLKPSNLFLVASDADDRPFVKVVDFGISHVADEEGEARLTSTRNTVGTPLYMSPEQIRTPRSIDARTDVWSLGVILYECLTGRLPFEGSVLQLAASVVSDPVPPPSLHEPTIPPALEAIVMRMLEKNPAARPASCAEVVDLLTAFAPDALPQSSVRRMPTSRAPLSEEARRRAAAVAEAKTEVAPITITAAPERRSWRLIAGGVAGASVVLVYIAYVASTTPSVTKSTGAATTAPSVEPSVVASPVAPVASAPAQTASVVIPDEPPVVHAPHPRTVATSRPREAAKTPPATSQMPPAPTEAPRPLPPKNPSRL